MINKIFVWHKCGTEAGSALEENVRIKESQRRTSGAGIFLWGVGSSIGADVLKALLEHEEAPEVLFTPIVSRTRDVDAKYQDSDKKNITEFTHPKIRKISDTEIGDYCIDADDSDVPWRVPEGSQVVSYENKEGVHYALVCQSAVPLAVCSSGMDTFSSLQAHNLVTGSAVGSSQTVAVVQYDHEAEAKGTKYDVVMRAHLVYPYVVKFTGSRQLHDATLDPETGLYHE